jgi:hypothetical protein
MFLKKPAGANMPLPSHLPKINLGSANEIILSQDLGEYANGHCSATVTCFIASIRRIGAACHRSRPMADLQ